MEIEVRDVAEVPARAELGLSAKIRSLELGKALLIKGATETQRNHAYVVGRRIFGAGAIHTRKTLEGLWVWRK